MKDNIIFFINYDRDYVTGYVNDNTGDKIKTQLPPMGRGDIFIMTIANTGKVIFWMEDFYETFEVIRQMATDNKSYQDHNFIQDLFHKEVRLKCLS